MWNNYNKLSKSGNSAIGKIKRRRQGNFTIRLSSLKALSAKFYIVSMPYHQII